jgi:sugar phosphate isomerase/epimerase
MTHLTRRECLKLGLSAGLAAICRPVLAEPNAEKGNGKMRLGLVTYNLAHSWDIPTIIQRCKATGFEGVELRTTHAHGVEPSLTKAQRVDVRKQFEDSGIVLWGLGSICDFHSDDPAAVKQNVETCKDFVVLAQDLGVKGVKVRPNGLQEEKGIPVEKTLEQIGLALRECGKAGADHGIEIWLEVHGPKTMHPPYIRKILDVCNHPSVGACWNSNLMDIKDGSVKEYFELLRPDIKSCHITELWRTDYPWKELFSLFKKTGYDRFTLAEIPESADPEKIMHYYKALWMEYTR